MTDLIALTRQVPDSLAECELTYLSRVPFDLATARAQHAAYESALETLGCEVRQLAATPDLPDSVFVEDTAIVLDEVAIITRPGAASRREETVTMADAVSHYRLVRALDEPATLDGGDVLRLGRTLYVGMGGRTNLEGAHQLEKIVEAWGYAVRRVRTSGCLHLKSAVTELAPGLVLVNPAWSDARVFDDHDAIDIDPEEPFAANVLRIGETILCASAHRRTHARLRSRGLMVHTIDMSELAKAEAGVTCCSVIFRRGNE